MARLKDTLSAATVGSIDKIIDSRRLYYFYHVAQAKRFTAAEALLDVAQSAISRQIKQLENDLGVKLLKRTGHGVELTEAGRILYDHAETILRQMNATVEEIDVALHAPSGSISIASPPSFNSVIMPDVIEEFSAAHPTVRVRLIEASTGGVYTHLANGDVDVAIVAYAASLAKIHTQALMSEPLFAVFSPDHALASKSFVTPDDLRSGSLVLPATLQGTRATLKEYFDRCEIPLVSRWEVDSLPLMLRLVMLGSAVALLPHMACRAEIAAGTVAALPLKPCLSRTLYFAYLRDRSGNPWLPEFQRIMNDTVARKSRAVA